jgi:uncharacterized protein
MSVDHIRYDLLTQDALRSVIRTVLADAAVKGLHGDHHFYITFDTRARGVRLSARLKASYPDEMTIVLQHQFWDLTVGEDDFDVGLAFNGIPERLHVPLRAVKAFADPSVQFGLQFAVEEAGAMDSGADGAGETRAEASKPAPVETSPPAKPAAKPPTPQPAQPKEGPPAQAASPAAPAAAAGKADASAEVVRLDRFRKK